MFLHFPILQSANDYILVYHTLILKVYEILRNFNLHDKLETQNFPEICIFPM